MIDFEYKLDASDVSKTFRVLRKVDPDLVKELRSELKNELKPLAVAIAAKYPSSPPLSGFMRSYGQWGWDKVVGKVNITPGKSRKGVGANNLVSLTMNYNSATPYVMDMAGWRMDKIGNWNSDRYKNKPYGQGMALYRAINRQFPGWPNGGRIFYKQFMGARSNITKHTINIINRWTDKVNRELS